MCLESFGGRQLHVTGQKLNYAKSNITVSSYTELAGAAISSRMHIFYNKTFRKQKAVGLSPLSNQFFFFFDGYQRVYRKLINPIILPLETILRNAFFNSKLRFVFFFCQLLFMQPLILFQEICNISFISQDLGGDETSSMNSL